MSPAYGARGPVRVNGKSETTLQTDSETEQFEFGGSSKVILNVVGLFVPSQEKTQVDVKPQPQPGVSCWEPRPGHFHDYLPARLAYPVNMASAMQQ